MISMLDSINSYWGICVLWNKNIKREMHALNSIVFFVKLQIRIAQSMELFQVCIHFAFQYKFYFWKFSMKHIVSPKPSG